MSDVLDNQAVYHALCIHANQTAHHIIAGRVVHPKGFWGKGFYWICFLTLLLLLMNLLEKKREKKNYAPAGLYGLLVRCTVGKPWNKSGFVRAPIKSARSVRNRGFASFVNTVHREEKKIFCGFPYGEWSRTVQKNIQRGTAPNCTVRYITAPSRTLGFRIFQNHTELHHKILVFFNAPNRTVIYFAAPHRTEAFTTSENRPEPHRKISDFFEPDRAGP